MPDPSSSTTRSRVSPELAYVLPMLVFLGFNFFFGQDHPYFAVAYAVKAAVVAILLILFRKSYTRITWDYWWLGLIAGVIGIFQWVPMQLGLQHLFASMPKPFDLFQPGPPEKQFNPFDKIQPIGLSYAWISVRILSAAVVVPFMEELFWRDFLWRKIVAPNDFRLAKVGEWEWLAYLGVSVAFAVVHGNWWLSAIVWGLMIGGLLAWTKSLGACIIMHATTNLLLAVYVLWSKDWAFW